jgi:hypothetical protein
MKTHRLAPVALTLLLGALLIVDPQLAEPADGVDLPPSVPAVDTIPGFPPPPAGAIDARPDSVASDSARISLRAAAAPAASEWLRIGLPAVLEREPGVSDPVFSILTRLVTSGTYGTITEERLQKDVARIGGKSQLPYDKVVSITREPVKPGWTALIRVEFKGPIDLPIPYSILGYHPGSFTAAQSCLFREWDLGNVTLTEPELKGGRTVNHTIDLEDVHLFASVVGDVKIDIDAWIDFLLGGAVDDTDITSLMLARWRGEWYGVAMGYGHDHSGRSGILSLRHNKILFPPPEGLRGVGRQMRARAELLGKVWDAGEVGRGNSSLQHVPGP